MELLPYEIWLDIKGFEGYYQISSRNRVRSVDHFSVSNNGKKEYLRFVKGKILKQVKCVYNTVSLCKEGTYRNYNVYRLVAEAFIPNPYNYPQVDHIIPIANGGTDDISNLRWVTIKMNANNSLSIKNKSMAQLRVSNKKSKSMMGKCVRKLYQYDKDGNLIQVYDNIKYTCIENGWNYVSLTSAITKNKTYKGYYFLSSRI